MRGGCRGLGVNASDIFNEHQSARQFTQELRDGGTDDWALVRHEKIHSSDRAEVGDQEPPNQIQPTVLRLCLNSAANKKKPLGSKV